MNINQYQAKAMSTCMASCNNMAYMLTGLTAEVGEVNDKIAKAIRKGWITIQDNRVTCGSACPSVFANELQKEIGDCLWFIAGIAWQLGYSLDKVAEDNLQKLADRQQRGVIDGNGDNR